MDDDQIIALYWARAESAIAETAAKYNKYCQTIAYNILHVREDAEECVSDTYLRAWHAMPPARPSRLPAFLGRITRNVSLDRYAHSTAEKRGGGQLPLALDELHDCIPAAGTVDGAVDDMVLTALLDRFLGGLSAQARLIFLRRYWYFCPVRTIADDLGCSQSKVKMTLLRARTALRQLLEEEGITL